MVLKCSCDRVVFTEEGYDEKYLRIMKWNSLGKLCDWLREVRLRRNELKPKNVRFNYKRVLTYAIKSESEEKKRLLIRNWYFYDPNK